MAAEPDGRVFVYRRVPGTRALVEEMEDLLRRWERVPVRLSRYIPGFIGVRLNSALYREAIDRIARGIIDARCIDTVVRETPRTFAIVWSVGRAPRSGGTRPERLSSVTSRSCTFMGVRLARRRRISLASP